MEKIGLKLQIDDYTRLEKEETLIWNYIFCESTNFGVETTPGSDC